ncbi:type 3 dihydrofolate reductase [Alteromonas gilva]|uniref:Dihydrofolate reductase n=1 Tax=Alteromonas gilva TaxID=2987522 RepID=A0ABT5L979_9ALTE|nr:type 3 dihydrofolate reductase [Alteromonas gilva]MDC8833106.1 type 3 dihydrofolate reductase [Alteromonas gilva]
MIAAMAHNRVIGKDNQMPWHMPADLAHFKRTTLGKPVIMGRKTYESIGRALPGRLNIVLTSDSAYSLADATVVNSIDAALAQAKSEATDEAMIIGGGAIYTSLLPRADRLYLTFIDADVAGDTYFPDYAKQGKWRELSKETHPSDQKNQFGYTFVTLERESL